MRLLALDSSGQVASVAIMDDEKLVAEYTVDYKKTHSQTLLPMLDEIVRMTETDLDTVDTIAVSAGPGSFTGLRIGSATAKGLAQALDKPIISVPTVEALAANLFRTQALICPIMDARRGQVYTGIYEYKDAWLCAVEEQRIDMMEQLIERLNRYRREVIFLGDGVPVYRKIIEETLQVPYHFAPHHMARQHAGAVASIARRYYMEGKMETAGEHKPEYLRLSQAERERAAREKGE
ncbi:MAG: tRNA (adenosine(37)-N6)-threonylcarbamoyltransferase complex dimerization subunit type 1 TsaB [Lachnospiraceae bacterium]